MNIELVKNLVSQAKAFSDNPGVVDALLGRALEEMTKDMGAQEQVYQSVGMRGYLSGYHPETIKARQVCKLGEELGELAAGVFTANARRPIWATKLIRTGEDCKGAFDTEDIWAGVRVDPLIVMKELPDIQVVAFCLAQMSNIDVASHAVQKSQRDVNRGVRGRAANYPQARGGTSQTGV